MREKLEKGVQPFLEQGETVRQVFPAFGGSPVLLMFGAIGALFTKPRVVAVTDRGIVVLQAGMMSAAKPRGLVGRYPRTPLAEPKGLWAKIEVGGEKLYVHKRFHKELREAA